MGETGRSPETALGIRVTGWIEGLSYVREERTTCISCRTRSVWGASGQLPKNAFARELDLWSKGQGRGPSWTEILKTIKPQRARQVKENRSVKIGPRSEHLDERCSEETHRRIQGSRRNHQGGRHRSSWTGMSRRGSWRAVSLRQKIQVRQCL